MSQVVAVGLGAPVAEPSPQSANSQAKEVRQHKVPTSYAEMARRALVITGGGTVDELRAVLKEQGWSNGWTPVDQNRFLVTMHGLADDKRTQPKAIKKRDPVTGKTRFEPTFLLMKEES